MEDITSQSLGISTQPSSSSEIQDGLHVVSPLHVQPVSTPPKEDEPVTRVQEREVVNIPTQVQDAPSWEPVGTGPTHRLFLDICCGIQSPLSCAIMEFHGDTLRFDILLHTADDLLDDTSFERLLRVCASGIIAYAGASPSCCEYSRLKLKPGGPPALRTPDHIEGKPGISGQQLLRVQESNMMLERCIQCLRLVISAGGHAHLEQPKSAMSWQEPMVQQFIQQESCVCVSIAACGYGRDWHKHWLLASTFADIARLACECSHPPGSHQSIAGAVSDTGHYLSRDTAEYPAELARQFGQLVKPLLTLNGLDISLAQVEPLLPMKSATATPFSRQDGGGSASQADWSSSHHFEDCFQALRIFFSDKLCKSVWIRLSCDHFRTRWTLRPFLWNRLLHSNYFLMSFCLHRVWNPTGRSPRTRTCVCIFFGTCAYA